MHLPHLAALIIGAALAVSCQSVPNHGRIHFEETVRVAELYDALTEYTVGDDGRGVELRVSDLETGPLHDIADLPIDEFVSPRDDTALALEPQPFEIGGREAVLYRASWRRAARPAAGGGSVADALRARGHDIDGRFASYRVTATYRGHVRSYWALALYRDRASELVVLDPLIEASVLSRLQRETRVSVQAARARRSADEAYVRDFYTGLGAAVAEFEISDIDDVRQLAFQALVTPPERRMWSEASVHEVLAASPGYEDVTRIGYFVVTRGDGEDMDAHRAIVLYRDGADADRDTEIVDFVAL